MAKKSCIVLIDGSNFYFKLKDLKLHQLLDFNFLGFIKHLAKDFEIVQAIYYVGAVRTDGTAKVQQMFNNQRKLFAHLRQHKFKYSLGYLLKSNNKFHFASCN